MTAIAIWTDGLGTYQAHCLTCGWIGPWRRKEATAVKDSEQHECGSSSKEVQAH